MRKRRMSVVSVRRAARFRVWVDWFTVWVDWFRVWVDWFRVWVDWFRVYTMPRERSSATRDGNQNQLDCRVVLTKPLHLNKFYSRRGPLVILHFCIPRIFHLFNPHRDRYLIALQKLHHDTTPNARHYQTFISNLHHGLRVRRKGARLRRATPLRFRPYAPFPPGQPR